MKRLLILVMILGTMFSCLAQEEASGPEAGLVLLNFRDAEVTSILQFYSEITGMLVVPGPQVKGTITLICPVKIKKDDAAKIIESVLEVNGFTMVRSGTRLVKVIRKEEAPEKAVETRGTAELAGLEEGDRVITQLIRLNYVNGRELTGALQSLVSKSGHIFADERTNTLIITDTSSNIKRIARIITELDIEALAGKIEVEIIALEYADEITLAETLNDIFSAELFAQTKEVKRPLPETLKRPTTSPVLSVKGLESLVGQVKIIPDTRLHSLVVITYTENLEMVKSLIATLDRVPPASGDTTLVYYLQNGEALELAGLLKKVYGEPTTATGKTAAPGAGVSNLYGRVAVEPDERTNSLVITTTPSNFDMIKRLVEKLDIEPPQVLIEALIVEVTADDDTYMGVDWNDLAFSLKKNKFVGSPETLWETYSASGFQYTLTETKTSAAVILQMLKSISKVEILSQPYISASNNEEARIFVGERVPIVKTIQQAPEEGATVLQSYEYKEVGIELTVTPRVNQGRIVNLKIHQTVDELGTDVTVGAGSAPRILKRESTATRVVRDGETVVIGGLIKDKKTKGVDKVPILGSIPILGFFFRKTVEEIDKRELLVFITPYVMLTSEEALEISQKIEKKTPEVEFLRELKGFKEKSANP